MTNSNIHQAKSILENTKGKPLCDSERCQIAIELAGIMLNKAKEIQTPKEKALQTQLSGMMNDPNGKVFTTSMTDQCFRSNNSARVANQLIFLLNKYGTPSYLGLGRRLQLEVFKSLGNIAPNFFVPLAKKMVRKETSTVILPGEFKQLAAHMEKRRQEHVRINLNHLGEAILSEKEALKRLNIYLEDLEKPEVEYISIKISTIFSQINLLSWENTLSILSERFKLLLRAAKKNKFQRKDGKIIPKFVNLDMEEYRDLLLTVELLQRVLNEQEFHDHSAGIVLQGYLPDSFMIQQKLTQWAMERVKKGGAPIKIRIVKGANLAMEQIDSAFHGWPQAPYTHKIDVDANFKRMLIYGCQKEHAEAAHLGIGSHNLFDIAYGLLLRAENGTENAVCFEMLEGMADHMRRVVQELAGGDMLLYCPAATKEEFQNAVAYLVRRFDENTAPQNFLRHAFDLTPGTSLWEEQSRLFKLACDSINKVPIGPRRTQDRTVPPIKKEFCCKFENEDDTDWSLPKNRQWADKILQEWSKKTFDPIPIVIAGKNIQTVHQGNGVDPSCPKKTLYTYSLADRTHLEKALETSQEAQKSWAQTSPKEKSNLLGEVAHQMRLNRIDLMGSMIADAGKTLYEADVELSEAIDFAEYYRRTILELHALQDIEWSSKGTVLVAPPWNFPCSIPAGGILAALATGNTVIFKPAPETILVAWQLVQCFWKAGISKEVLQFFICEDEPIGTQLIQDPRISTVVLTGATATAKMMMKMRPGLDLLAETGGKNAMIISSLSDRDLAIKDLIQSAFGHAGQKCSACSLAICEAEVYDDPHFREQLRDAAASLLVGSPWKPSTKINPLIRPPAPTLLKGLTELAEGEEWLLEPKQDVKNPNLWSPGIKLGVKEGSFMHQNELFGPVLALMRADNLDHAICLANGTPYGLTSGIHSLDEREIQKWMSQIEAGNCYVNRGITGAIVQRQPFGGCKESSFGPGAKAGGPNYLIQFMIPAQKTLPQEQEAPPNALKKITVDIAKQTEWNISLGSYAFYWNHYFSKDQDPSLVLGQDNLLRYVPRKQNCLRVQPLDNILDIKRVIAGAIICGSNLEISRDPQALVALSKAPWIKEFPNITIKEENESQFIERLYQDKIKRVRLLTKGSQALINALSEAGCSIIEAPVLANGRLELLHHLREVSFSIDYHRYGNLGEREKEKRNDLVAVENGCHNCLCGPNT